MNRLEFQWDTKKDKSNSKDHGITFDEARTVFYDESAIQFYDPDHSDEEDRFILLGSSFNLKTLVVCHCFRENETIIRIISARKADKDEEQYYWSEKK
ncbi:MAG TPA: BrnT family toxin [Gammaproteobacteria bacterium]|nr:BrnT family toxin [Gammaproteobacteria bacterium]